MPNPCKKCYWFKKKQRFLAQAKTGLVTEINTYQCDPCPKKRAYHASTYIPDIYTYSTDGAEIYNLSGDILKQHNFMEDL
jgi:hypothetical protein